MKKALLAVLVVAVLLIPIVVNAFDVDDNTGFVAMGNDKFVPNCWDTAPLEDDSVNPEMPPAESGKGMDEVDDSQEIDDNEVKIYGSIRYAQSFIPNTMGRLTRMEIKIVALE